MARSVLGDSAEIIHDRHLRVLLLVSFTLAWGTPLISPVLGALTGPFEVSAARIGLLVSVFSLPAIVVIPLSGVLADRYGRKPVLVGGLVLFGLAGLAIALTTRFRTALVLRLLQGLGWAGVQVTTITGLGDLYSGAAEATAQGLRVAMLGISSTVMPILAGVLVAIAWQYPFLLYGLALPIALVAALWLRDPTASGGSNSVASADRFAQLRALARFAGRPSVVAVLVARTTPGIVFTGFLTYNSLLVVRGMGGTPGQAGILVALFSIVFATAATQAGRATAAFDGRAVPLVGGSGLMTVGLVLAAVTSRVPVAMVGTVVMGLGFGLLQALYRSVITDLPPDSLRGGLVSLGESLARAAMVATPIVMGAGIARLEPSLGTVGAIRWITVGTGGVVGIVGGVLILGVRFGDEDMLRV